MISSITFLPANPRPSPAPISRAPKAARAKVRPLKTSWKIYTLRVNFPYVHSARCFFSVLIYEERCKGINIEAVEIPKHHLTAAYTAQD